MSSASLVAFVPVSWLAWFPLAATVVLALRGGWLARTLPPAVAVRLVPLAMVATAAGTGVVLAGLGVLAAAQLPAVAVLGRWSARRLGSGGPLPLWVDVAAGVLVLVLLATSSARAVRSCRDLLLAAAACRELTALDDRLVLVATEEPQAYALPSLRRAGGRIVVSAGLIKALDVDERRALLAHEEAHLAGRHHLWLQLADIAAAANPLLVRTARGVGLAVERAADEAAALEVADRAVAARALAKAALATAAFRRQRPGSGHAPGALAAADRDVTRRATALLAPAPRPRRVLAAAVVLLTVGTLLSATTTADQVDDRLDHAEVAPTAGP